MLGRCPGDARIGITGVGGSLPSIVLGNEELAERLGVTSDWIRERSGIAERRLAGPGETTASLAAAAARAALETAGRDSDEVELVIVATSTPDMTSPATAAVVAAGLGLGEAAAYDVSAACTGFVYALAQAYAAVATGLGRRVLVVGAETLSRVTDWRDRGTAILFGDGAGAAVVERVREGGFLGFELGCDGRHADELTLPAGGTVDMDGAAVYRFSTRKAAASAGRLLECCELTIGDVDLYAPHQSNKRIIDQTVRRLGLPPGRVLANIERVGNTSAASIPLLLADSLAEGRLEPGATVLMSGVGAGLTWGSALLRWGTEPR